ncbi:MAG: sodium:proline symporter [Melioribacteraceae bacterium]|nr:MAG: sodium:proline symporter [Melioribacteraceae bacterium]
MINLDTGIIVSFFLYLSLMLFIGVYYYRRTKNLSDYILGGRGLGAWVTSLSAQASDMSGWLLLGLPGYVYLAGYEAFWLTIGLAVGTYINWKFVAAKLRDMSEAADNSITLPDYFESRFEDKSKLLRVISAVFILLFFLIYTSSGFVAGAKLFSTVFGLSYYTALFVGVLVIIGYTFMGGFMAVSMTDFFQGILMFIAVLLVPVLALEAVGGPSGMVEKVGAVNENLLSPLTTADGSSITLISTLSLLAWGLGYYGQPHILARFMAIKSSSLINKSRKIAMTWVVISLAASMMVGIIGLAYYGNILEGAESEKVFILLVNDLFPSLLAGIFLSAILAAVMSTADSQLLVASSAISEDFYKVLIRKNASEKELVLVSRIAVIVVAAIALVIAMDPESSVLELVAYAWAGFGAAFGPLILFSIYWKGMTRNGALAGLITGGLTVIIWKNISGGIFELYELLPGFLFASFVIYIVSKMGTKPEYKILDEM